MQLVSSIFPIIKKECFLDLSISWFQRSYIQLQILVNQLFVQNDPKCEHKHIEGCHDAVCVEYRLVHRAPKIGGAARTALLGWFAVLAERVAGCHAPKHWEKKERKEYLDRIQVYLSIDQTVQTLICFKSSDCLFVLCKFLINQKDKTCIVSRTLILIFLQCMI